MRGLRRPLATSIIALDLLRQTSLSPENRAAIEADATRIKANGDAPASWKTAAFTRIWLFKPNADPGVLTWIDAQSVETLYLSTITLAEIRFGIATMPDGERRTTLHQARLLLDSNGASVDPLFPYFLSPNKAAFPSRLRW